MERFNLWPGEWDSDSCAKRAPARSPTVAPDQEAFKRREVLVLGAFAEPRHPGPAHRSRGGVATEPHPWSEPVSP